MASRLSALSIKEQAAAGLRNLPWRSQASIRDLLEPVDFNAIMTSPNADEIIQAISPQRIYYSLIARGLEDAMMVLPMLSTDQWQRMLDYDAWDRDQLSAKKAFTWLSLLKDSDGKLACRRYRELEEEYQIALLQGLIQVFDREEMEQLPQAQQDALLPLPGDELFYRVLTDDSDLEASIIEFVNSCLADDIAYGISLLQHAHAMPPAESEAQVLRFRNARLEEDGFVPYDQSLSAFVPLPVSQSSTSNVAMGDHGRPPQAQGALTQLPDERSFLERVMDLPEWSGRIEERAAVRQRLLVLANTLCAATQLDPANIEGLKSILAQVQALVSLGLEELAGDSLERGAALIAAEHPQVLFRTGLGLIASVQDMVIARLQELGVPGVEKLRQQRKLFRWGEVLTVIDTQMMPVVGFELAEGLKGLFNRFPMRPVSAGENRFEFVPIDRRIALNEFAMQLNGALQAITPLN